jgi:hypothetical protein
MSESIEKKRGFATLSPERLREIASMGGKAAVATGKMRKFTSEEARVAGRKGGAAHSREHMQEIGRKGGLARGRNVTKLIVAEDEQ